MVSFSFCKINIGLNIINKRKDGFHNIETLFYPVHFLKDIIEIVPSSMKDAYHFSGIRIVGDIQENLCFKTVNLLRQYYDFPPIELYLHKNVPMGAGLGGGSANVATIINVIEKQFNIAISEVDKLKFASQLGSDCAFFINSKPSLGSEKGNALTSVQMDLSNYFLTIVKPPIHVSTHLAYSMVEPFLPKINLLQNINQPIESWRYSLKNDFEKSVFNAHPEIKAIKNKLYDSGAIYAQMSGSGSAVFGIFGEEKNIEWDENYFVFSGKLS